LAKGIKAQKRIGQNPPTSGKKKGRPGWSRKSGLRKKK